MDSGSAVSGLRVPNSTNLGNKMNERIGKLVEKAEEWVCKNYPDAMDDNDEFHAQTMHKLAELIVRECMELGDKALQDGKWPGDVLKEHFGVKE
jgi:hypothetical protein